MLTIRLDGYPEMINIGDEVPLSKYYENYCRDGFLEAMWNSPNLLGFEKNDCSSPISRELVLLRDPDREVPKEYLALFASLQNRGKDSAQILRGILDRHLKGGGKDFWDHNGDFLRKILDGVIWNEKNCRLLCGYLLLFIQLSKSRTEMLDCEKQLLINELYHEEDAGEVSGRLICPNGAGGICCLRKDGIYNIEYAGDGSCTAEKMAIGERRIVSFAMLSGKYLLAVDIAGKLISESEAAAEQWRQKGCPPLKSVAACGPLYQMLTESGEIITNVKGFARNMKGVRQIGAGLNSLSAVKGDQKELVTTFDLASEVDEDMLVGVREARTRVEYDPKTVSWLILQEDGTLWFSDGEGILKDEEVEKADLCRSGVFYVQGHTLWRYYYGDEITERIAAVNSAVKELYCETAGENTAVYLWQEENEIPERILLNGGSS